DRIHHDLFPEPGQTIQQDKMGVVPIFELLREQGPEFLRLGILCGTLVVLPATCVTALEVVSGSRYGLTLSSLRMKQLAHDRGYVTLDCNDQNRQHIVAIATELFRIGEVTALVGTRALLGEGWDAPVINTLILANNVGSHVSSNQMRGRALRTVPNNADKVSNIWHIASISTSGDPGPDMERLTARFKTYMGLGLSEPIIENGLERMGIVQSRMKAEEVIEKNKNMLAAAKERHTHTERWQDALNSGSTLERHKVSPPQKRDELVFSDQLIPSYAVQKLVAKSVSNFGRIGLTYVVALPLVWFWVPAAFPWIAGMGVAASLWQMSSPGMRYKLNIKREEISWEANRTELENIGMAVLQSLKDAGWISREFSRSALPVYQKNGKVYISVKGATTHEESIFLEAFAELYDPVKDPRYILTRTVSTLQGRKTYYHSLPTLLARNKRYASYFEKRWNQYVGEANVLYTKSLEGMKALLKARGQQLRRNIDDRSRRISRWK
ncbi:MAG: hypothetical protein AAFP70_10375, partial [Calditrichota bacterium]